MAESNLLNGNDGGAYIALPDRLDTAAAPALLADLSKYQGQNISLDFIHVTMIGTLCLQILMNARHQWALAGQNVSLANIMPPVEKALADFGTHSQALMTGDTT